MTLCFSIIYSKEKSFSLCDVTFFKIKLYLSYFKLYNKSNLNEERGLKMECMNCGGTHDVIDFVAGNEKLILCVDCRVKLAKGQLGKVGRPSLGVTKKVSLTLPEEDWNWVDEQAKGNRSQLIRYLINQEQSSESRWSNNACLGYAILGAKKLGYNDEQIHELVRAIYGEFDWKSVDEAKDTYNQSSY